MVDLIGCDESKNSQKPPLPQCMVFEWMDTDLWQLPSKPFRSGSQLPRIVARSILEALAVIDSEYGVHTDVNPNNIFLSGVDGPSPIVKLGDLGNCTFFSGQAMSLS
jgi:serine/threonine protein kinase